MGGGKTQELPFHTVEGRLRFKMNIKMQKRLPQPRGKRRIRRNQDHLSGLHLFHASIQLQFRARSPVPVQQPDTQIDIRVIPVRHPCIAAEYNPDVKRRGRIQMKIIFGMN